MFYNGSTGRRGGKSGDFKRGMGLGLSLCRSIVEVHGGTLDVRNVNPHGSEFSFTLGSGGGRGRGGAIDGGSA